MLKAILFDKDGTLFELGGLWDRPTVLMIDELLGRTQLNVLEANELKSKLGLLNNEIVPNSILAMGSNQDVASVLAPILKRSQEQVVQEIEGHFLTYFQQENIIPPIIPGVREALQTLSEEYTLGLVTNDSRLLTLAMLQRAELSDYFQFIATADEYRPKPDPEALLEFARQFDIALDEMVYIGDSVIDSEYGRHTHAAISFVAANATNTSDLGSDYTFNIYEELVPLINQIKEGKVVN